MASLFGRLRSFLPGSAKQKTAQEVVHVLKKQPFYQRPSPWWARLTWGMVAADFMITTSMTEVTWKKWTEPVDPENPAAGERLKSIWPRAGLCVFHITVGAGLAAMIFIGRSRVVRTLDILRPGPGAEQKQLFIQGAHHRGDKGLLVPFAKSRLDPGRDHTEVILRVAGMRGHWWVALNGAKVNGHALAPENARSLFMSEWGIRSAVPTGTSGHWTSGPIVKN
ncbi:hypothetical protein DENSPDRAFT_797741 [Dentipellis sp. KUC8613]|nr:hypothetical protein DENSPDRAFT_797741 [Dentipellis sp. KUC8613]